MQSSISSYCLKLSIDGQLVPQLFSKFLFQVSVRELYSSIVIHHLEGGLKKARDAEDNIIISDSTLRNILPPQLKKMTAQYKLMCGCECCKSAKIIQLSFLTWPGCHLKHLKDISHNAQTRRPGELSSFLFETYKNALRPHGCCIYNSDADMDMAKMFPCTSQHHVLLNWKCVLRCCEKCPSISKPH